MPALILSLICILLASALIYRRGNRKRRLTLPPGPICLPLVGSSFNVPKTISQWEVYSKKYGSDLIYMRIRGTHIIVVNSHEIANELLEKRCDIYSSRTSSYMTSYLLGCHWLLTCLPHNDERWHTSRQLLEKYFSQSSTGSRTTVAGFTDFEWQRPHVIKYTYNLLQDLLQRPDLFLDHNFELAASSSLSSIYGLDIAREGDELITLAQKACDALKFSLTPGHFLVDSFPVLRFAPQWVKFKRLSKSWRADLKRFLIVPFLRGKDNFKRLSDNVEAPSLLSQELSGFDQVDQVLLQESSATAVLNATSSTSAALNTFFLAMTCFPEAQKRAQAELDTYLSNNQKKVPSHADLEHLPFCMGLVYEVLRWHVVNPIAIPHLCTEDDIYGSYRIPRGSVVIPNVRAMMKDPRSFEEPCGFRPQRFLNADGSLSVEAVKAIDPVFGFGRRVCVGRSLGLSILAHASCCVLALYDIKKKLNDDGASIDPLVDFESLITSSPLPFTCSITPRNAETAKVVLELSEILDQRSNLPPTRPDSSAPCS